MKHCNIRQMICSGNIISENSTFPKFENKTFQYLDFQTDQ